MNSQSLISINNKVIALVKPIKILDKISWPAEVESQFFLKLKKGNRPNLKFKYPKFDYNEEKKALLRFHKRLSTENSLENYTKLTIESYCNAIDMIHAVGTSDFQKLSIEEYGRPSHLLFGSKYSHLQTAKNFIDSFKDYEHPFIESKVKSYSKKRFKQKLEEESYILFKEDAPKIVFSDKIVAKATASKNKIRLRRNAKFSRNDFKQLLVHEIMVHTLTSLNGTHQDNIPLLSMGAPRTTKTQEGLATFSEIITGSLDLSRLKRISLRVVALEMALNGADFYELYEYFKDNGQNEKESYLSASRILRGGKPSGGIAFTKDGVYLEGLIRVHSFFRWAFKTRNLDLIHLLFCGRLEINDIFMLREAYKEGVINQPRFLPDWYLDVDSLAGKMAFSLILNGIDLESVEKFYSNKFVNL